MTARKKGALTSAAVSPPEGATASPAENELKKIFILLRDQTGHDFSQYKASILQRRVDRRMALHHNNSLEQYVSYLQQTPAAVQALFADLLIGVTNFFRDPDAFQALEQEILPRLFDSKPAGANVRVWSAGCSTGEEAYSIAILLHERLEALKQSYTVQLFATDLDSRAIATARAGLYPADLCKKLSPQRLARFFTAEPGGSAYRIHKEIRDMVIFSEQDVIQDPPFSKLDLISCRNLLIYLGKKLQRKLISLFHYALNPGGVLFLGTSESVGEFGDLFAELDRKAKLYQRKANPGQIIPAPTATPATPVRAAARAPVPLQRSLREVTEQAILQQVAPASALVNERGDVLYLHGRTGMYLEPAPGESTVNNIVKMARDGLRSPLTTALHQAGATKECVRCPNLRVKSNGHITPVNLSIHPVTPEQAGASLYLVTLETAPPQPAPDSYSSSQAAPRIASLELELLARDETLRTVYEELETSHQEFRSSNEEMQSMNEELETSKEELQSTNEELTTLNAELRTKLADLGRANNDINNLLSGTGIATVFVDLHLRILSFTPTATQIIYLIPGDVGRPVAHILTSLVGYERLVADIQAVLNTLAPHEREVQTREGKWYTLRVQPYRTLNNVIEGAVVTFVDITETVRIREALHAANDLLRLAVVVRDAHDAITVQDLDGRMLAWNPAAVRMYGWSEAEALLLNVRQRIPQGLREEALAMLHQLSQAEVLHPYCSQRVTKAGAVVEVWMTSTALLNESGQMYAIATTERARPISQDARTEAPDGRPR